ncbi:MAG: hypothetical protein HY541_07820 [Deltaproteobacteria bacterium]|nr:hypothetical protein [Deltaproteobacteria bacterium]
MWLISLVAVVFCSYFLARMTANFIGMQFDTVSGPSSPKEGERMVDQLPAVEKTVMGKDGFKPIVERNIFDSESTGIAEPETAETDETEVDLTGEAVPTSLGIKLISTFSVGGGGDNRSTCIIDAGGGKGKQDVYTVDDKKQFAPETKIVKILNNRVEFVNKGRLEYVELEDFTKLASLNVPPAPLGETVVSKGEKGEETKIEQAGEGKFVIDRAEIDAAIANLDKLYTQIRAVPHFKEGKPDGLKLLSVKKDSVFAKLGLKRGDILQKINGMELDIKKGLEIFNQLKTESDITIDVERGGAKQSLEYEIR